MKNIIQQPIILAEFIMHEEKQVLYISSSFIYTIHKGEIHRYNLYSRENYTVIKNNIRGCYIMKSLQHPQWAGFIHGYELDLLDITTGKMIYKWLLNDNSCSSEYHVWDEKLGLLIPIIHSYSTTQQHNTLTFEELDLLKLKANDKSFIHHIEMVTFINKYRCYLLNFDDNATRNFFDLSIHRDYNDDSDILMIRFVGDNKEELFKIRYSCPHMIEYYFGILNVYTEIHNNSIMYTSDGKHTVVQYLDSAVTVSKTCNCK